MAEDELLLKQTYGRRELKVDVESRAKFHRGGKREKYAVEGVVRRGDRERNVRLVERSVLGGADEYVQKWNEMREVGLPVVPTMRLTGHDTVVMTDLTADGSALYGKGVSWHIKEPEAFGDMRREQRPQDKIFINLVSNDESRKAIREMATSYAEIANRHNILLPLDDPFELVVKPDGDWRLVCLDLEYAILDAGETSSDNERTIDNFMESLSYASSYVKQTYKLIDE